MEINQILAHSRILPADVTRRLYCTTMNKELRQLLFLTTIAMAIFLRCHDAQQEDIAIVLANKSFSKSIYASDVIAAPIHVAFRDSSGEVVAKTTGEVPLFEFILNNRLITSNDPIWLRTSHTQRPMQNEGVEHCLKFQATEGDIKGLKLTLLQQIFPNSTLIREKLVLGSDGKSIIRMNKHQDQLHFKFPQYSLVSQSRQPISATELRLASWELMPITFSKKGAPSTQGEKHNHMFYPHILSLPVEKGASVSLKGPLGLLSNGSHTWLTSYEHASQDNLNGIVEDKSSTSNDSKNIDPLQGTVGVFDFPKRDDDFKFIDIQYLQQGQHTNVSINLQRGGYLDNQEINPQHPYTTVWSATAFYQGSDIEYGKSVIRHYLFNQICEKPASRIPEFYYNTWGMQREESSDGSEDLRGVLTYERIFEEIEYASELGIDIFVLDDGWEQDQGNWTPHSKRLPQGLAPIKQMLDKLGIKLGVWFSPAGIDSTQQRYHDHPEWIILDSEDNPIQAQWGDPAFDMVSSFSDLFVEDCKKLIDQGVLFFKWDAINTFYSSLPNLHHGSDQHSEQELRERYAYLLPIYITKIMEELTDYEPDLIIEIDVTEARRVMMGLAPLSQGKLFFMNNGASGYQDYSTYRSMSMRTIPNVYNGIIPLELFTYANYPINIENDMHYNANTSLISGHGFWGNLRLTSQNERQEIGNKVRKSKQVLPYLTQVATEISGKVGDPLEIYTQVNPSQSAGQLIVFNVDPYSIERKIALDPTKFLGVLHQPYRLKSDTVCINMEDHRTYSTQEAFILPRSGIDIAISSSTCALEAMTLSEGKIEYVASGQGEQNITWDPAYGNPRISSSDKITSSIEKHPDHFSIKIITGGLTSITVVSN